MRSACCVCLLAAGLALPAQHVAESWNSAEFFANKLLREFRGVNEAQVAWVQALKVRLQQPCDK
jgi:adenylyl cyclase-associated protein